MMIVLLPRREAKRLGLKRYYTGAPCVHGHLCERYVRDYYCLECSRAYDAEKFANRNTDRYARKLARAKQYYWDNRQGVLEKRASSQGTWAGGFMNGPLWRQLRYQALVLYGRKCMCCGCTTGPFHVDHIKPRSRFPDLALDITNLQVLCEDCNMGKGAWDQTDWRPNHAIAAQ